MVDSSGLYNFEDDSLMELFRTELENNYQLIENCIVEAEITGSSDSFEPLMRAAHSVKGAARIIGADCLVELSHAIEDVFSAAMRSEYHVTASDTDLLLKGNDVFRAVAESGIDEIMSFLKENHDSVTALAAQIRELLTSEKAAENEETPTETKTVKNETKTVENEIRTEINTAGSEKSTVKNEIKTVENEIPEPASAETASVVEDPELLALFVNELETHSRVLELGLIDAEKISDSKKIEPLMRAAHSVKGAARIMGIDILVELAHAMETLLQEIMKNKAALSRCQTDILLKCNDIFKTASEQSADNVAKFLKSTEKQAADLIAKLKNSDKDEEIPVEPEILLPVKADETEDKESTKISKKESTGAETSAKHASEKSVQSFVRVSSANMNKIMALAGESLVQARSTKPFSKSLLLMKSDYREITSVKDQVNQMLIGNSSMSDEMKELFLQSNAALDRIGSQINRHLDIFEKYSRGLENLAERLYAEAIATRMRPFSEGIHGFPRMVRDLSRQLGKEIRFVIEGENTKVDRDILEQLESPLTHLIRNAADHGIESISERRSAGKADEGTITLRAGHRSGMLIISVEDDGKGIDAEKLRKKIADKGYTTAEMAQQLNNSELMEFLFLPGFSTAKQVTEISGRGVGLDVVFTMVQQVGGTIRADSEPGKGTAFMMQLPLTLSVLRSLIVDIGEEKYAFPLSRIDRILDIDTDDLMVLEDKQYYTYEGENIGIIDSRQVFGLEIPENSTNKARIVILSDRLNRYGIAVDSFAGETDLVVTSLNSRLGKIPNISAGASLEDGSPVLILDTDDIVRTIDNILQDNKLRKIGEDRKDHDRRKPDVLIVDDSLTVREVERRLLESHGYSVTVAVDGADAWNTLQSATDFDLIITDIDMPRMNGFELVEKIRADIRFRDIPVMIVSYKDSEADKRRGLEAGANYYFTKSSFHDETLINAVVDLIGEA